MPCAPRAAQPGTLRRSARPQASKTFCPHAQNPQIGAVPDVNGIWPAAVQIEMICALLL